MGNEYMIAVNKKQLFMSRFTLAFFDSMGWYYDINYQYAEPTTWGKNQGCPFKNIENCNFPEFCTGTGFGCDWDFTGIAKCQVDSMTGSCKVPRHFTDTMCIDENF